MVTRTIRHGKVKIGGDWYAPDERFAKYDGRLDGLRYCFGRYPRYEDNTFEPFVYLWGSQAASHGQEEWGTGPEIVDGYFVWVWWRKVEMHKEV